MKKNLNRYELLKEFYDLTAHNLHCYSADGLMTKAKDGFEESWFREKEKLELIEELIEDERQSKFKIYHSIKSLKDIVPNKELAYLEDRKNGTSCYLKTDELNEDGKAKYDLVFSIHKKDAFDDEYDNVYIKELDATFLNSRNILKNKMEKELAKFNKFIEKYGVYSKFYEDEEPEEFE